MISEKAKLRRITAFARDAGVTVRALHLYDRLDLLKPAALTESAYRLYGEAELARLEQILALQFLGFTLEQIKELLGGSTPPLGKALRMQRAVIVRRKRRLESALVAIDEAERALAGGEAADLWATLRNVIEVFEVQNDWEWTKKYYSEEALERVEERQRTTPGGMLEQGERDWSVLIADVEQAIARGVDPSSDEARTLAARWRALLAQFTHGDTEIQGGLNRMWSDSTHWPPGFKRPWSDAADAFVSATMNDSPQQRESKGNGAVGGD